MIIRKAFKFRLKTTKKLEEKLHLFAGHCRFIWNKSWHLNMNRLKNKLPLIWYQELDFWSKLWKSSDEFKFLKECPSQLLQQKLMDLTKAFKDGFDKRQTKRLPRAKKRGVSDNFRFPQGFKLCDKRIFLPKLGWISFFKSRSLSGLPKNVTVSRRAGNWYVSIQTEQIVEEPVHASKTMVGVDLGIIRLATLSTGQVIHPVNSFRRLEDKLGFLQNQLSRKKKYSQNWKKQRHKISKLHRHISAIRLDALHKASNQISKNHAIIVLENLKVSNMSRSAKGTVADPGRNVQAKSGLNKSILDQGWFEFRRQLSYKQSWRGGQVLLVSPKNTSITCPVCRYISKKNRVTQSEFLCTECRYTENADLVGALNVLRAGHAQLACGAGISNIPVKQEPLQDCLAGITVL
jgi:IS605 OrfB family transposase